MADRLKFNINTGQLEPVARDHEKLRQLDFNESGHTGFQKETYVTSSDPTSNNDSNDTASVGVEFRQGDFWLNTSSGLTWVCLDATPTSAVWEVLGVPKNIYIKADSQSEGNLSLSDSTNWDTNKALIKTIDISTSSTDWDLTIYPDDDFDELGLFPSKKIIDSGSGNATIYLDEMYEDGDASGEVHVNFTDNSGSNTFDIHIRGERAQ